MYSEKRVVSWTSPFSGEHEEVSLAQLYCRLCGRRAIWLLGCARRHVEVAVAVAGGSGGDVSHIFFVLARDEEAWVLLGGGISITLVLRSLSGRLSGTRGEHHI